MNHSSTLEKIDLEILNSRSDFLLKGIKAVIAGDADMDIIGGELGAFRHAAVGSLAEFTESEEIRMHVNSTLKSAYDLLPADRPETFVQSQIRGRLDNLSSALQYSRTR